MNQYNTLNAKLSNLQLDKLKSGIRNGTEVTFNLSSNLIGNSKDGTSFFINYCKVIQKLEGFVNLLQIVHQLII